MESIMQVGKECYITGYTVGLQKHHIFFGTANRIISEQNGFWVWLIPSLHNSDSQWGVHHNDPFNKRLRRECQKKYEETHTREAFIALIGENYLDEADSQSAP